MGVVEQSEDAVSYDRRKALLRQAKKGHEL